MTDDSESIHSLAHIEEKERTKQLTAVLHRAIDLLSRREHSASELYSKLSNKGFEPEFINQTLERLQAEKLQSDERFTESFINERKRRGHGPIKIQHQLYQKGVRDDLIELYLQPESTEWLDLAQQQYQKKYTNPHVNNYNDWSKRARFLQSRGFTSDQIRSTVIYSDNDPD